MATNIDIDRQLLNEAMELSKLKTVKAVVNTALAEFVRLKKQQKIVNLFGTIDFDEDYDYKLERSRQ